MPTAWPARPRLAELVASLSFATDAIMGQPIEHALRSCVIAMRLAERAGLEPGERDDLYWVSLLAWIGCSGDPHELAAHFGDDIEVYASAYAIDLKGMNLMRFLARRAGAGEGALERVRGLAWLMRAGTAWADEVFTGKCEIAEDLAGRLGMRARVRDALQQVYERWDGQGSPRHLKHDAIARSVRAFHVAEIAEVHHHLGGVEAAAEVVRARRGTQFDPALADAFAADAPSLFTGLDAVWDAVMDAEPEPHRRLRDDETDVALEVMADFASLKSPFLAGHARGVAGLAEAAARATGMDEDDARAARWAGLVHDLGRMGVSNAIWDKPGPLTDAEREQVRLHPYLTERMLSRSFLAPVAALASMHHERTDGSGYHRGVQAGAIPPVARLLAAADAYHAMLEERPHRPALTRDAAAAEARREAAAGRLDPSAVEAVLGAAGHARARTGWPNGLSDREVEVLRLLARGMSKKQVASALVISPSTADHHVRHIYAKAGVTTRAGATLFAMRTGLAEPLATGVSPAQG